MALCGLAFALAFALVPGLVQAAPSSDAATPAAPSRHWRLCLATVPIPPYLTLDEKQPGVGERLLMDAAKQAGLNLAFEVFPAKRCRLRMVQGQADALLLAPTEGNLLEYQFPMRGAAVDTSRRIASAQLVWVKRQDSPLEWDGYRLQGVQRATLKVGTRTSVRIASESLKTMGLKVDDTAFDAAQLLRKLAAGRVDAAVILREEALALAPELARQNLLIVPQPLLSSDFYLAIRPGLTAARQAQAEAWWDAIGKLRDRPEYRPY